MILQWGAAGWQCHRGCGGGVVLTDGHLVHAVSPLHWERLPGVMACGCGRCECVWVSVSVSLGSVCGYVSLGVSHEWCVWEVCALWSVCIDCCLCVNCVKCGVCVR